MPQHHTTKVSTGTGRRSLAGGAALALIGAAYTGPVFAALDNPDAELLALRAPRDAAIAVMSALELSCGDDEEGVERAAVAHKEACRAIIDAPAATTADGLALKAAAAMHQLRLAYNGGRWPGAGEEMAWRLLSGLARSAYTPPALPAHLLSSGEPERA